MPWDSTRSPSSSKSTNAVRYSPPSVFFRAMLTRASSDTKADGANVKDLLTRLTSHSTFPNVLLGGVSVGGADDLAALSQSGKLREYLDALKVRHHHSGG